MTSKTKDRITIVLDKEVAKKVRKKQAQRILATNESVSFSNIIEDAVRIGIEQI